VQEITVGVVAPAYVNIPLWVAQERGFLDRRGLRATERILGTTDGVTRALRQGEVDIALTAPEGSIADAVAGGSLRVVAGLIDRPPLSMIALPRHRTFGDLRGGRIGTSSLQEGTRHVAQRMLAAHGLTYPGDYDFALEGSHVERWKALRAGTIDAALQMIPYDYLAADAGFTNLGPVTEEFALNAACVGLRTQRELVRDFLQALAEAAQWFRGNIGESAAIAAARTSVEPTRAWDEHGRPPGMLRELRRGRGRRRPGRHVARGRAAPRRSAPGGPGTAREAAGALEGADDLPAHR
jgi:ABC-type nitrate/sulfonate/bicarbonate transport system substrate-binding protein